MKTYKTITEIKKMEEEVYQAGRELDRLLSEELGENVLISFHFHSNKASIWKEGSDRNKSARYSFEIGGFVDSGEFGQEELYIIEDFLRRSL